MYVCHCHTYVPYSYIMALEVSIMSDQPARYYSLGPQWSLPQTQHLAGLKIKVGIFRLIL
jgi:hypothetical protein